MKHIVLAVALTNLLSLNLQAEDLQFHCVPRNDNDEPYRTFEISIEDADTDAPRSRVDYEMYESKDSTVPNSSGTVDGFARDEVYQTQITSRYRMIRIEGGDVLSNFERDVLQLQKRTGTEYKGLFEFPEGSNQLDLSWNSTLVLVCERTQ